MPYAMYDADADALYVALIDGVASASQKTLDDLRIIDYSEDGAVVGVEFICASGGIDLHDVPFAPRLEKIIGESGLSLRIFA